MTVAEIIAMIETTVAGLEEQLELPQEQENIGEQIKFHSKQNALLQLKIDILKRVEAEA